MTNKIEREYVVLDTFNDEFVESFSTRSAARKDQKSRGGAANGYKILQQFIISREVR